MEETGLSENDQGKEDGKSRKKKSRRMVFEQKPTLVKNPSSLLGDITKLESVFFQTNVNLKSSAVENLFTNRVPMNHSKYKFMFL